MSLQKHKAVYVASERKYNAVGNVEVPWGGGNGRRNSRVTEDGTSRLIHGLAK